MRYEDIINLPHHVSSRHRPMPLLNRAAQFAPFAALTGHDAAIAEMARHTSDRVELSPADQTILSRRLAIALKSSSRVVITYFHPDPVKNGGCYLTVSGEIKKLEKNDGVLTLSSGHTIPLANIFSIDGSIFDSLD